MGVSVGTFSRNGHTMNPNRDDRCVSRFDQKLKKKGSKCANDNSSSITNQTTATTVAITIDSSLGGAVLKASNYRFVCHVFFSSLSFRTCLLA